VQVTYGDFRKKFKSARLPLKKHQNTVSKAKFELGGKAVSIQHTVTYRHVYYDCYTVCIAAL